MKLISQELVKKEKKLEMSQNNYTDGWVGFTKKDLTEMYNTNTAQYPIWVKCYTGLGFDARATLKANGLHPDKIPTALRDHYIARDLIKKISEHIELKYVETPEE